MPLFGKKPKAAGSVDFTRLPEHVAIIMDGNGRWAKKHHLPRSGGHAAGAETFRSIATYAKEIGLRYLTVYAFSTENWKRPKDEVDALMGLLRDYLEEALRDMEKNQIHMAFFGDLAPLDPALRALCEKVETVSRKYTQCNVHICLNYGGRNEILQAARTFAAECVSGERRPEELDEALFSRYLYTKDVPDPDLIIRPSGEMRLSNFLLWQAAYAEFYVTDICWPDFKKDDLLQAIHAYQLRQRRFGGT